MHKIPGPALCGFADMFEDDGFYRRDDGAGDAVVGAKGRTGTAGPNTPKTKPYPKAKQSSTVATHAKVLKHARQVLAKAKGQVRTAARKRLAKPVSPRQRVAGPYISVHGDDYVVVGASAVPPRQQPKVKAALAKLDAAKAAAKKAAATSAHKTKAAGVTMHKLAAQIKAHEGVARKLSGRGSHAVHGFIGADAAGNNPGDPGYDPTSDPGSPQYIDPNAAVAPGAGAGDGSGDGTAGSSAQLDVDTLVAAANQAGTIPPDQMIMDSSTWPIIKYDESKGRPDGCLVSYGLATRQTDVYIQPDAPGTIDGTAHFGYVWKTFPQKHGIDGIPWGEDLGGDGWNHVHGRHWYGQSFSTNNVPPAEAFASYQKTVDLSADGVRTEAFNVAGVGHGPARQDYGPLVGNPAAGNPFNHARVDANGVVFWIANEAPDWLTAPLKAAAALTKAAADKAQKDADAAAAAAAAKTAADQAAALAAQNAQNALDEANAASQARQQASAASAQSAQAQADADAADAAQAQADAQAAGPQYQQDLAQQQFDLQQQQLQAQQDAAQAAQDLAERKWAFQQQQAQAQADAQAQPDDGGGAPPPDDGGGFDPEGASDAEAAQIEADADVLGAVLGRPTIVGDDAIIGGDGEAIGLDQWGNSLD